MVRMPNAICDKCKSYLHEICISRKSKEQFIKLMKERSRKVGGIIYCVVPGIAHCEIANKPYVKCDGTMQVRLFHEYPNKEDEQLFKCRLFGNETVDETNDTYCLEWVFNLTKSCCNML